MKVGSYATYRDAYRYGSESRDTYPRTAHFVEAEVDLQRNWYAGRGSSALGWDEARFAIQDAWERFKWTEPKV